jgi:hypothetical protein
MTFTLHDNHVVYRCHGSFFDFAAEKKFRGDDQAPFRFDSRSDAF